MKYTGWAVLIIGVLIGVYGLFTGTSPNATQSSETTAPAMTLSPTTLLLGFSAVAIATGLGMLLLGGRGVIKTKNLAVRN